MTNCDKFTFLKTLCFIVSLCQSLSISLTPAFRTLYRPAISVMKLCRLKMVFEQFFFWEWRAALNCGVVWTMRSGAAGIREPEHTGHDHRQSTPAERQHRHRIRECSKNLPRISASFVCSVYTDMCIVYLTLLIYYKPGHENGSVPRRNANYRQGRGAGTRRQLLVRPCQTRF